MSPLNHEPEALAWAIRKSGHTQTSLRSELLERGVQVSKGQLSEMVSGSRNCRESLLAEIAMTLNCPVVALERKREPGDAA